MSGLTLLAFPLPIDVFSGLKDLESILEFMVIISDLFEEEELRLIFLLGPGDGSSKMFSVPRILELHLPF